ncbi:PREDICTED: probable S-adenosylmethionine-dependent methyltransferase CRG1 [Nanorana parkeri]|uniref:probable S-adenosylmethionine-dependent methyltransferase CRG1 n=1 Tax=Nanorana parkeri TaxID=125878 RepID=UPI000854549C|nr:PREDICTED: probable S-adenosylmethionine-dependent methyltransferase CRG1 [Nanorana parkeri]
MSVRLFEEKEHASNYKKFRIEPQEEIINLIFSYLNERLPKPHGLAVDVGCGTGQSTRILSPYFQKVLGTDISEAQIEEAKKVPGSPNVTYSACPAEELPVGDASVDLLTASAAVHWFNIEKFLKEVDRILKPRGCLAFFSYLPRLEVHYKDCSEQMSQVFSDVFSILGRYQHERINLVRTGYKEIFEAIPYSDKIRVESIVTKIPMSLSALIGLIQTLAMFQTYLRTEPEKAMEMIRTVEQRSLQIMGASSTETVVEVWFYNVLVLACKPQ